MKYIKKPVVIEALQLTWSNWDAMCDFAKVGHDVDSHYGEYSGPNGEIGMVIPTLEGKIMASEGDWIIKGIKGELYPCKPDIFEQTYEPAE